MIEKNYFGKSSPTKVWSNLKSRFHCISAVVTIDREDVFLVNYQEKHLGVDYDALN